MDADENALLNARIEDFRRNPDAGIPLEELRSHMQQRTIIPHLLLRSSGFWKMEDSP